VQQKPGSKRLKYDLFYTMSFNIFTVMAGHQEKMQPIEIFSRTLSKRIFPETMYIA